MPIPLPIVHSRILTKVSTQLVPGQSSQAVSDIQSDSCSTFSQVIEFCEYHRPDRAPLMRPKDPPPVPNNTLILVSSDHRDHRLAWAVATVDEANARMVAGTITHVGYKRDVTGEPGSAHSPPGSWIFPAGRYGIDQVDLCAKQELKEKEAERAEKEAAAGIQGDKVETPMVEETPIVEDTEKEEVEPEMQRMTLAEEGVADKAWDAKFIEVCSDGLCMCGKWSC